LAQAIGRWGNFFNSEVYGTTTAYTSGWSWLPNWVLLQMNTNNGGGYLGAGQIHVPLFLVESLLNIAGYFLIVYGVGKGLKKVHRERRFARLLFPVVWHRPSHHGADAGQRLQHGHR
jgi:phosphatidylglycerol:prolipoprotein diacylglycerol transferase